MKPVFDMDERPQKELPLEPRFVSRLTGAQLDLYAFICMLLGNRQDAQDVLQDTNVMLMRHAGEYDPERAFLPWAKAFAHNQVRAYIKRGTRSRLVFDEALVAEVAEEMRDEPADSGQELALLETCLGRLTAAQKELISAHYYRAEKVESLAAKLGRSAISVYVQLHRIRRRLGECVEAGLRAAAKEAGT